MFHFNAFCCPKEPEGELFSGDVSQSQALNYIACTWGEPNANEQVKTIILHINYFQLLIWSSESCEGQCLTLAFNFFSVQYKNYF